jgi:hypothetical protein
MSKIDEVIVKIKSALAGQYAYTGSGYLGEALALLQQVKVDMACPKCKGGKDFGFDYGSTRMKCSGCDGKGTYEAWAEKQPERSCLWQYDEHYDKWDTDCDNGFQLTTGTPIENKMKFCPYCGRKIEEKK